MGVATQQATSTQRECASSIPGVPSTAVNDDQYLKLIRAHVAPLLRDVDVRHYDGFAGTAARLLVAIAVEAQGENDKPFIVDRVAVGDDNDAPHGFGWPTRSGSDTHWEHAARIQQLLTAGLRPGVSVTPEPESTDAAQRDAESHLALIDGLEDFAEWAYIAAQAIPRRSTTWIVDFYGEFRDRMRTWHGARTGGFNLALDRSNAEPLDGGLAVLSSRSAVLVSRNGAVTAAALASPNFLGWAQHERTKWSDIDQLRINPFPLVEYITETVRFAYEMVAPELGAVPWQLNVIGRHLTDRVPVALKSTIGHPWPDQVHPALTADLDAEVDGTGEWSADSFALVAEVYGQGFGVGRVSVPFARDEKIDFQLMEATRSQ